jgi:hypothetical protein
MYVDSSVCIASCMQEFRNGHHMPCSIMPCSARSAVHKKQYSGATTDAARLLSPENHMLLNSICCLWQCFPRTRVPTSTAELTCCFSCRCSCSRTSARLTLAGFAGAEEPDRPAACARALSAADGPRDGSSSSSVPLRSAEESPVFVSSSSGNSYMWQQSVLSCLALVCSDSASGKVLRCGIAAP